MYKIKISKLDFEKIKRRKREEKDKKIYRRLQYLHLKYEGKTNKKIADIIGVSADTITDWAVIYSEKGLTEFCKPMNFDRRSSAIDSYIDKIKQDIKENTISTLAELQNWIKDKYSLTYGKTWIFECCKKNSICLARRQG